MPEHGEITFERRRYGQRGGAIYTWAYLWVNGEQHRLGDPAPSITFPKADLDEEIERKLKELPEPDDPYDDDDFRGDRLEYFAATYPGDDDHDLIDRLNDEHKAWLAGRHGDLSILPKDDE